MTRSGPYDTESSRRATRDAVDVVMRAAGNLGTSGLDAFSAVLRSVGGEPTRRRDVRGERDRPVYGRARWKERPFYYEDRLYPGDPPSYSDQQSALPVGMFPLAMRVITDLSQTIELALGGIIHALRHDHSDLDERPLIVDPGNSAYSPPPYSLSQTAVRAFMVPADWVKVQRFCDTLLNEPAAGALRYEVLTSNLIFVDAEIKRLSPLGRYGSGRTAYKEREIGLWAIAAQSRGGFLPKLVLVPLFLFIDLGPAIASGREIYGFPKLHAQIKSDPRKLAVEALVHHPDDTVEDTCSWHPIIELEIGEQPSDGIGGPGPGHRWNTSDSVRRYLLEQLFNRECAGGRGWPFQRMEDLFNAVGMDRIPMVFLKQCPDVDGVHARYQAIVEAAMSIDTFRGAGFIRTDAVLRIHNYATLDLGRLLGIYTTRIESILKIDLDLRLPAGHEMICVTQ